MAFCDIDVTEEDDGSLSVDVSAGDYTLQFTGASIGRLKRVRELLSAAPTMDDWDQVKLGVMFGASVLLVCDPVVRIKVLVEGRKRRSDLVEIALREDQRVQLLDALTGVLGEL